MLPPCQISFWLESINLPLRLDLPPTCELVMMVEIEPPLPMPAFCPSCWGCTLAHHLPLQSAFEFISTLFLFVKLQAIRSCQTCLNSALNCPIAISGHSSDAQT